jgi:sialic acid synthase SpsE
LKYFDRVFISISGFEISSVEKIFKKYKKSKKLIFTYGFQSFPTDPDKIRLGFIDEIYKKGMQVCYADHTNRDNIFQNILIINQAIKSGSNIIEKHVILDKDTDYIDKVSSLDVNELNDLKNFFSIKFKNNKKVSIEEKKYSSAMERNGVFFRNLHKGERIIKKDIIFLRTGKKGLTEEDLEKIYKKELKKNVKKGQIVRKKYFY